MFTYLITHTRCCCGRRGRRAARAPRGPSCRRPSTCRSRWRNGPNRAAGRGTCVEGRVASRRWRGGGVEYWRGRAQRPISGSIRQERRRRHARVAPGLALRLDHIKRPVCPRVAAMAYRWVGVRRVSRVATARGRVSRSSYAIDATRHSQPDAATRQTVSHARFEHVAP